VYSIGRKAFGSDYSAHGNYGQETTEQSLNRANLETASANCRGCLYPRVAVVGLCSAEGLALQCQERLTPQQRQGTRPIGDLALAGHAQGLPDRHEADLHQFRWLAVGLTQLDSSCHVDISSFIGDAIGGVELADVAQFRCGAADFFQQLIVLKRQVKRPALTWHDRALFVLLASKLPMWKEALVIVQPETVLRWHRELFRWVWRRKSRPRRRGKPPLSDDIVDLIRQMAQENLSWGAERIRGELLKLGMQVSKSTIQKC
jgi:hypothetical protein